jgi:hypothetical protein
MVIEALFQGRLAASSRLLRVILGFRHSSPKRTLGPNMAFGAGGLVSAFSCQPDGPRHRGRALRLWTDATRTCRLLACDEPESDTVRDRA